MIEGLRVRHEFRTFQHMRRTVVVGLLLNSLIGVAACGSDGPAMPTPAPITVNGTWAGAISVQGAAGQMTWSLTQAGDAVTGPVLVTLPSGTVLLNGVLTGTVSGATLTYSIAVGPDAIPSQPSCTGQMTGTTAITIATISTLIGPMTASSSNCAPPVASSTITLTRQ
jgi:hypothetical protein